MDAPFGPSRTLHEEHAEFADEVEDLRRVADSVGVVPASELRDRLCASYETLTSRIVPHAMAEDGSPLEQIGVMPLGSGLHRGTLAREHAEIAQLLAELDGLRWELAHPEVTLAQQQALRRVLYGLYALIRTHLLGSSRCACDAPERRTVR